MDMTFFCRLRTAQRGSVIISLAQNLKHRPIRCSKMVPTCLACTLDGTNELDARRLHGGSCYSDIVHPEGDHRAGGEKRVKLLLGAIEFHLRAIAQLKSRNLRFVSNGLHTHHIAKE